jgi:hypothetical protein
MQHYNNSAASANKQLAANRTAYESTTAPLMMINGTLKEMKDILNKILIILQNQSNN